MKTAWRSSDERCDARAPPKGVFDAVTNLVQRVHPEKVFLKSIGSVERVIDRIDPKALLNISYFISWGSIMLLFATLSNYTRPPPSLPATAPVEITKAFEAGDFKQVFYADCSSQYLHINSGNCLGQTLCIENSVVRCPAACLNTLNKGVQNAAGVQLSVSRPFVAGDNDGYYISSQICAAGIHSGIVSQYTGGCFRVKRLENKSSIKGSEKNGVVSIGLEGVDLPVYKIVKNDSGTKCVDYLIPAAITNGLFSAVSPILFISPKTIYYTQAIVGFWLVVLFLGHHNILEIVSSYTRCISFCLYLHFVYNNFTHRVFDNFAGARRYWLTIFCAALNLTLYMEIIFYKLKFLKIQQISASNAESVAAQSLTISVVIGVLGFLIFVRECMNFWEEKRLLKYAAFYTGITLLVFFGPSLFSLRYRIHHWMMGIYLMPIIQSKGKLSLLLQGISTGLFVHGVSRWDFASAVVA